MGAVVAGPKAPDRREEYDERHRQRRGTDVAATEIITNFQPYRAAEHTATTATGTARLRVIDPVFPRDL